MKKLKRIRVIIIVCFLFILSSRIYPSFYVAAKVTIKIIKIGYQSFNPTSELKIKFQILKVHNDYVHRGRPSYFKKFLGRKIETDWIILKSMKLKNKLRPSNIVIAKLGYSHTRRSKPYFILTIIKIVS